MTASHKLRIKPSSSMFTRLARSPAPCVQCWFPFRFCWYCNIPIMPAPSQYIRAGSQVTSPGQAMNSAVARIRAARKGRQPRNISSSGVRSSTPRTT